MNPLYVDIAFAVLAILLALQGWRQGFVRMAGSLAGLVLSVTIATWGLTWFEGLTGWKVSTNPITFVIVFLLLTLILTKIMGILIGILDLVRKIFSIIPFVGLTNSILGFAVGLIEAVMIVGAVAYAAVNFFPEGAFRAMLLAAESVSTAVEYLIAWNIL